MDYRLKANIERCKLQYIPDVPGLGGESFTIPLGNNWISDNQRRIWDDAARASENYLMWGSGGLDNNTANLRPSDIASLWTQVQRPNEMPLFNMTTFQPSPPIFIDGDNDPGRFRFSLPNGPNVDDLLPNPGERILVNPDAIPRQDILNPGQILDYRIPPIIQGQVQPMSGHFTPRLPDHVMHESGLYQYIPNQVNEPEA